MFDYLRNLRKSDEERRQELLTAYLDGALTSKQRQQVESDLAQDEGLAAELDEMRLLQQEMRQLPQRRVRRNFTLDPALYGRPRREPLVQAYPALRTATVMAAFLFIFVLAANIFLAGGVGMMSSAEPAAVEAVRSDEVIAEAVVEEEGEAVLMATPMAEPTEAAMIEAAPMEEVAEAPMVESAEAPMEEAAEAPMEEPAEAPLAEEADGTFDQGGFEAESAVPMEEAAVQEMPEAESPAEEKALLIEPTMMAEGTIGAEQTVELDLEMTAEAVELAELTETRSPAIGGEGKEASTSVSAIQIPEDGGQFTASNLQLLALLLGVVFVLLIILTLLARRRM
jgi:hypothetical protein